MRIQYLYFRVKCIKLLHVAWQVKTVVYPALVYLHIVELVVAENYICHPAFPERQLAGGFVDNDILREAHGIQHRHRQFRCATDVDLTRTFNDRARPCSAHHDALVDIEGSERAFRQVDGVTLYGSIYGLLYLIVMKHS